MIIRWLGSGPRCGIGEIQLPATQPGSSDHAQKSKPGHVQIGDDGVRAGDRQRCDHHLGWCKRKPRAERDVVGDVRFRFCMHDCPLQKIGNLRWRAEYRAYAPAKLACRCRLTWRERISPARARSDQRCAAESASAQAPVSLTNYERLSLLQRRQDQHRARHCP